MSEVQNQDIIIVSQPEWEKAQEIRESRKDRLEESRQKSVSMYESNIAPPSIREENLLYWELHIADIVESV